VVKNFWGRLDAAGDIYSGTYEGLYCKGHEAFMKEDELTADGLCPDHKIAPELVREQNYFFRLSNYQQKLLDYYAAHGDFVAPSHRFNEVRAFVEEGLEDISFSREKKEWGIRVPNDPNQVIYVWADALVNYISAVGMEGWEEHRLMCRPWARTFCGSMPSSGRPCLCPRDFLCRDRSLRTDF